MSISPNNKRAIILALTILFVSIITLYFQFVPKLINIEKHRPQIEQAIKENLDVPVVLGKLDTSATWNLGIKLHISSIDIKHPDNSDFISTGHTSVELSMLPFLRNKIVIREIKTNNPAAYINRSKAGKFDIEQLIPKKSDKPSKFKPVLDNTRIIANNYQIYFNDEFMSPMQKHTIVGDYVKISDFDPDKFLRINTKGQVVTSKKPNTYFDVEYSSKFPIKKGGLAKNNASIKGQIQNLYPNLYLAYINKYAPRKYSSLQGKLNMDFDINLTKSKLKSNNFMVKALLSDLYAVSPVKGEVLNIVGPANVYAKGKFNNDLTLEEFNLVNKKSRVKINGKISKFKTKNKVLDLKLLIDNSRAAELLDAFPKEIKVPLDAVSKVHKHNIDANLSVNLTIKGRPKTPDLFGDLKFNDLSIGLNPIKVPKGYGKIEFLGKSLLLDIYEYTDQHGLVKAFGMVSPVNKTIDLNVKTGVIDLKRGRDMLLVLKDILNFKLGPVPDIYGRGSGKVDLNIRGKFKAPSIPGVNGYLEVLNARGYYENLYGKFHDVKGTLKFDNDRVVYNGISGFMGESKVIAEGYTTLKGYSDVKLTMPDMNLVTGHELISNSPLLVEVKDALKDIKEVSGHADTVIYLTGTEKILESKGELNLHDSVATLAGFAEPFKNLAGKISFINEKAIFTNLQSTVMQSQITTNGSIENKKDMIMVLSAPNLDLNAAHKFVKNSPALANAQKDLQSFINVSGHAKTEISLNGKVDSDDLLKYAKFNMDKTSLITRELGYPIEKLKGELLVTPNGVFTEGTRAEVLGIPIRIAGQVTGFAADTLIPQFKLQAQKFEFDKIKELLQAPIVPQGIRNEVAKFKNLDGQVNIDVNVDPKDYKAYIKFDDVQALYSQENTPIELSNGGITVTSDDIYFDNLNTRLSKSRFYLDGAVKNYRIKPVLNVVTSAEIVSTDIDKYINQYLDQPIVAKGAIPISATLKGNLNNWDILAQMTLDKGTSISFQPNLNLPDDKVRIFNLKAAGTQNKINIQDLEVSIADTPLTAMNSASLTSQTEAELEKLLKISGIIDGLQTDNPVFQEFRVLTPSPFDITLLNNAIKTQDNQPFFSKGEFIGSVMLQGRISSPQILGNLTLNNVAIPSRDVLIDYAITSLNENEIIVKDSYMTVAESPLKVKASISNIMDSPLLVKSVIVYSPSLDIDKIAELFKKPVEEHAEIDLPPFVIENGVICADELIIHNLITNNMITNLDFTPDWLLTVSNLSFETAGGIANGQVLYNLKTTELAVDLTAKDMQANAAATTLMSLPNEVYGVLSGDAQFRTRGSTSEELIANANGVANFEITDGRLVRLGSLEYLLRAANVVQSGVAGLNINNILDLIAPQETGHFETLKGTVIAKDGTLKTDNIASQGKNLSLYFSGNLDMVTNTADITILGRLSKKVSGLLGPLGSVSINTFIGFIPGLGFLPSSPEKGLVDVIPGLSKIPVLGLGGGKYRRFAVEIDGDLYNPSSVKSFRWVD